MCFGKPVFLSRLTSLPEVGGDAAYYFDDFDGSAMRRTVQAVTFGRPGMARRFDLAISYRTKRMESLDL